MIKTRCQYFLAFCILNLWIGFGPVEEGREGWSKGITKEDSDRIKL